MDELNWSLMKHQYLNKLIKGDEWGGKIRLERTYCQVMGIENLKLNNHLVRYCNTEVC